MLIPSQVQGVSKALSKPQMMENSTAQKRLVFGCISMGKVAGKEFDSRLSPSTWPVVDMPLASNAKHEGVVMKKGTTSYSICSSFTSLSAVDAAFACSIHPMGDNSDPFRGFPATCACTDDLTSTAMNAAQSITIVKSFVKCQG